MIRTLLFSLFILPVVHDFHFSRTKAHYNPETSTLQMSMNVFTDDLELALRNMGHEEFKIEIETDAVTDSLIAIYALQNFKAHHAGEQIAMDWVGYECDYDVTYLYVESAPFQFDSTLSIAQTILLDTYDDQENVLDFESPKTEESHIFTRAKFEAEFEE